MELKNTLGVCIWSQDFEKLAAWYENVLGLKVKERLNLPDDTGMAFEFGDNHFYVGKHSEVVGESKDPYRIMIGFNVPSVPELYERIKDKDIEFVATPFEGPPGGFWCMTLKDPDGNIIQFFSDK